MADQAHPGGPTPWEWLGLGAIGVLGYLYVRRKTPASSPSAGTGQSGSSGTSTTPATPSSVTLQASATQVPTGQAVALTATAPFASGSTPGGSIQIQDQTTGAVVVTGAAPTVSTQVTHNHPGTHTFVATWMPA